MSTKYSRQRETLLKVLCSTDCHPDADWIYTEVRKELPNISLGTVYRNLSNMSREGTILKLSMGDGKDHFDGNTTLIHHHMMCRRCGSIIDIFTPDKDEKVFSEYVSSYAQTHTSAIIQEHSVMFYGICSDCNK